MSQTKLRFRYDFEAADGTKIRVRVKANLRYSQISDEETGRQSTRLRAKVGVSVLQQTVSSGMAPLLETPEGSGAAKDGISQALDLFHQAAEAATSLFLDGDPLDGDALIAGLVEAFNGLSESIDSMLLSSPADSQAAATGEAAASLEAPVAEPAQIETVVPIDGEPEPLPGAVPQDVAASDLPENELVQSVGPAGLPAVEDGAKPEAGQQEEAGDGRDVAVATDAPWQRTAGSVMLRLRLQVMQSLSSLVGAFDSDSSSLSIFQASARLDARWTSSGSGLAPRCRAAASTRRRSRTLLPRPAPDLAAESGEKPLPAYATTVRGTAGRHALSVSRTGVARPGPLVGVVLPRLFWSAL